MSVSFLSSNLVLISIWPKVSIIKGKISALAIIFHYLPLTNCVKPLCGVLLTSFPHMLCKVSLGPQLDCINSSETSFRTRGIPLSLLTLMPFRLSPARCVLELVALSCNKPFFVLHKDMFVLLPKAFFSRLDGFLLPP